MITPTTCDQSRRCGHEDHQACFSFIPSIIARSRGKNKYCERRVTDVQSVRVLIYMQQLLALARSFMHQRRFIRLLLLVALNLVIFLCYAWSTTVSQQPVALAHAFVIGS